MANTNGRGRRPSRFDQLTPEKEEVFSADIAKVLLTGRLRSFKGASELREPFEKALKGFQVDVQDFGDAVALTDAFVLMCNSFSSYASNRAFSTTRSQLKRGVLAFARLKGLHRVPLTAWPIDFGEQVANWLRDEARTNKKNRYSLNTARKYYGAFCGLFAEIGEHEKLNALLPQLDSFPNNAFSGAHDDTVKTKSLGLPTLIGILRAARSDYLESVRKARYAQALFRGPVVSPDKSRKGLGQFRNLDTVLWYLHIHYQDRQFPAFTSWRDTHPSLFVAINKLHGGWGTVREYFHPLPSSCVAPIILLTIYGHFNVEPLRILRLKDVKRISILRTSHVEVRTAVQPGKERAAAPYRRSFPIDDADPASPNSIIEFMLDWRREIACYAGKHSDCIFIFVTQNNKVMAFSTTKHDGRSGDSKWTHHLEAFCARHGFPEFNLKELRFTSLDFVREIADNDIREMAAMKGGSSGSVISFHYDSDASQSRKQATVASLQSNEERYVRSGGKSHHLGAPKSQDLTAATPGCMCADPYDSPIPGEVKGVLCGAFGCCPGCPHGAPQLESAYALARLLQLREALRESRSNLPLQRWLNRFKRPLEVLENNWLPMFDSPNIWERVQRMSLPPIGVIE